MNTPPPLRIALLEPPPPPFRLASRVTGGKKAAPKKSENFFSQFGFAGPTSYYTGGFEPEMTRREAALTLVDSPLDALYRLSLLRAHHSFSPNPQL